MTFLRIRHGRAWAALPCPGGIREQRTKRGAQQTHVGRLIRLPFGPGFRHKGVERMTRVEALQAADEFVAKVLASAGTSGRFNGVVNLAERVDLTLRVARFLLEGQPSSEADDLLKRDMRNELDQAFPPLRTS